MRLSKEVIGSVFEKSIHGFQLRVVPQGTNETWLVSPTFVISLSADIDGTSMRYIDPETFDVFDLALYLVVRRGGVTSSASDKPINREERILREFEIDARLLSEKAPDILGGEKQWMKDYGWSPLRLQDPRDRERVTNAVSETSSDR